MKNKKVLAGIIAVGIIVGLLLLKGLFSGPKYETQPVEYRTITQVVEASGTINPVNTYSVGSTVSGLVTAVYADYNSPVKKGQLLAVIDPRTLQETVNQSLAAISAAQANLRDMQSNADMSLKTLNRYKNLYRRNFIPKSELDQAESDYISAKSKVVSARDEIAKAQAQYRTATVNLGFTRIVSPVDGVVISKQIEEGQPVAASFQAPEHFVIAQDLKKMQIEVNVSEADIASVKEGQEAEFTLDGYPDTTFKGIVRQVRLSPTTVSNVVTYTVVVAVDNEDLKLKPGMTANVSIITSKREHVLCIPSFALKFTPDPNGPKHREQGIWILKGHKPKRIPVKTGLSDDSYTEIISNNIKEGDLVITGIKGDKKKKKAMSGGGGRGMRPPF
ncbi:MAG: efflux RND transporter periplasmic adaptor subunit [Cyanobacteria bacterium RUI128]|nr:efflux RND transporter periplasmic adaptor subunit [Cyanobacteria bacterium RUI128]